MLITKSKICFPSVQSREIKIRVLHVVYENIYKLELDKYQT